MDWILAAGAALWLGLLTALSPCPLATNVTAISYLGKQVDRPTRVLLSGLAYTLGRTLGYIAVALIVVQGLLSLSTLSQFLQDGLNRALGPVLLLTGLLLLEVIPWPWVGSGSSFSQRLRQHVDHLGLWGAAVMGLAFAISFCPVSAALFFGSLVPLAVEHESQFLLPSAYGVGTALPVVAFSILFAFSAHWISRAFDALTRLERWMRRVTALIFLLVGTYLSLVYLVGVF